jgi:hypothetical protein
MAAAENRPATACVPGPKSNVYRTADVRLAASRVAAFEAVPTTYRPSSALTGPEPNVPRPSPMVVSLSACRRVKDGVVVMVLGE